MKNHVSVITVFLTLSLLACQDARVNVQEIEKDLSYYRHVGEQIPFATGMDWMNHFHAKNEGRSESFSDFAVSSSQLTDLVTSVDPFAGMAFHWGYDDEGSRHVIAIPIDDALSLWSDIPGRVYLDANTGSTISREQARDWATNYRHAHPDAVWYHFFGGDVFDEMAAIPFFNAIDIKPAINTLDQTPQLLLIVWNNSFSQGRAADDDGVIYDASNPCPPCGVQD